MNISDILTVSFDKEDDSALCVTRKYGDKTIMLKMESGDQADILYRLLTEQLTKVADIRVEGVTGRGKRMKKYILKEKSKNCFTYKRHNEIYGYDEMIEISFKNTWAGYKGVQVSSFTKGCNTDGFNNALALRKNELLRLPFMIAHFMLYRIFTKNRK